MNVDERIRSALESDAAGMAHGDPMGSGSVMKKGRRRRTTKRVGVAAAVVAGFVGSVLLASSVVQQPAIEAPSSTFPVTTVVEDVEVVRGVFLDCEN